MNKFKTIAVIVTYFPDSHVIATTIASIRAQVAQVYVVDNTPGGSEVLKNGAIPGGENTIELITLTENVGIARAQNIGIQRALEDHADFVVISDQDTTYPGNYVEAMLELYAHRGDKNSIAALAPAFTVSNKGGMRGGFVQFEGDTLRVINPQQGCHEIAQAIASGMLIPSKVFSDVGYMDEELFIDSVDSEWCWRARAKGYTILGCADVVIAHCLGDTTVRWWRYAHDVRSPVRDYYIVRNGIHLALRSPYLSREIRRTLLKTYLRYAIFCIFFGTPHTKHFWYATKGLYHGLIGQLGPYA
jgi:rhamnosyltransferase